MKSVLIKHYSDSDESGDLSDLHPVLQQVYRHRKVSSIKELDYQLKNILDFSTLKGIQSAAEIVSDAIRNNKSILIVGDFDADGATSTAVAIRLLKLFGAQHINYLVPNRFDYGYGLTAELLRFGLKQNPDLIITVDNGISSIEGVRYARDRGIDVVVTDHHLSADQLPNANAIVNPNQPDCEFESKSIAGVGVIFYLMMAVRSQLREQGWFNTRPEPNIASVLDLVALGTVADVVALDRNNRILVDQGLRRIRAGQCCAGIRALMHVAGRNLASCNASDLGFAVAPRLNAAGRLEDMSIGIECLLSDDEQKCQLIAAELHQLNLDRRSIESDMLEQAMQVLDKVVNHVDTQNLPAAIAIYNQDWHQGVIGILASRIKEKFHRPVIAFAPGDDGTIKGSARSIKGLHIRDALDLIDKKHNGLIHKFGGHAMAAGLTIAENQFEVFKAEFEQLADSLLSKDDLQGVLISDGKLAASDFDIALAEQIRYAGPWGQHFPEPLFDNTFIIEEWRIVGECHLKMKLIPEGENITIDAIAFNTTEEQLGANCDKIRAVFKLDVNEFRNNRNLQLMIEYLEPA